MTWLGTWGEGTKRINFEQEEEHHHLLSIPSHNGKIYRMANPRSVLFGTGEKGWLDLP